MRIIKRNSNNKMIITVNYGVIVCKSLGLIQNLIKNTEKINGDCDSINQMFNNKTQLEIKYLIKKGNKSWFKHNIFLLNLFSVLKMKQ